MALFDVSSYHDYIDLQNVSGSGDPASAPAGGIYLFASGTAGSAKLFFKTKEMLLQLTLLTWVVLSLLLVMVVLTKQLKTATHLQLLVVRGLATVGSATDTITVNLDIDGMSTATTAVADADLLIIDDGANGTNNKITRGNLLGSALAAFDNGLTSTTVSASSTLQAVGAVTFGGALNVSGNSKI